MSETESKKNWLSPALYVGMAFLAFFPCLVLGKAYFANDLLAQFGPWRMFLRDQLLAGHFPLWNPYLLGGQPFFADLQNMMLYPVNYLTLLFPNPYGLSFFLFLHMALASFGMHFWLKSLRLSEGACRLGALTFSLSGLFWWETIHPPIIAAIAWLPWFIFLLEKLAKSLRPGWAFLSGLCFALIISCGNFQAATLALYSGLAYFFFRLLTREAGESGPAGSPSAFPWKKFLTASLFVAWGGLPLLAQFIPANEFSQLSSRRGQEITYDHFNGTFSMVPQTTYEFLFPSLGVPPDQTLESAIQGITDQINIGNDFIGAFGYIGIWAPFLIALSFKRKDKKFVFFLGILCLLSILTAWGRFFPLHRLWCEILPGINLSRAPFRFIQAYVLFGCGLLGFGYQSLERWLADKNRPPNLVWGLILYAGFFLLVSFLHPSQAWREMLALGAGLAGLLLWALTDSWKALGKLFFSFALVLPLLFSGWGGFSLGPASNFDFAGNFPAFSYLASNKNLSRYYFDGSLRYPAQMGGQTYAWNFPENAAMDYGIRTNGGYNPLFLTKSMELKTIPPKTYFQLWALKGFVTGKDEGENPGFIRHSFGNTQLYESAGGSSYLTAPYKVSLVPENQVVAALSIPDFNPSNQVVFSKPLPAEVLKRLPVKPAQLSFEMGKDEPDDQSFQIHLDSDSLVSFSEVNFPGWKAFVDGQPSEIFTANSVFRALFVPSGEHSVEFRFEPSWFKPILLLTVFWLLSAVIFGLLSLRRKKDPSLEPNP